MTTSQNKNIAVSFKNITKKFGSNISFDIYEGEILSLLGENGSGKTTLMNMLSGIYYQDEGQIIINGQVANILSPHDAFKYKIGMIHQHFKLVDTFTCLENIVLGIEDKEKSKIKKKVKVCPCSSVTFLPFQFTRNISHNLLTSVTIPKLPWLQTL